MPSRWIATRKGPPAWHRTGARTPRPTCGTGPAAIRWRSPNSRRARSFVHAVAVSGSGMRSLTAGHTAVWVDRTDPLTRLSGRPGTGPTGLSARGHGHRLRVWYGRRRRWRSFTAIQIDGGAPVASAGATARATVIGNGVHTVAYYARDAAGNVNDGDSTNGHANAPPSAVPVRIDRDPPTVAFTGAVDPSEPELIAARVADRLSGPDAARGEIAVRAAGSNDRFQPLPTGGRGETLRARWQSDDYPEGEYEFRVTGYDAAGNRAALDQAPERRRDDPSEPTQGAHPAGRGAVRSFRPDDLDTEPSSAGGSSPPPICRFRQADTGHRAIRSGASLTRERPWSRPTRRAASGFASCRDRAGRSRRGSAGPPARPDGEPPPAARRAEWRGAAGLGVAGERGRQAGVVSGAVACPAAEVPRGGVSVQLQFRAPGLDWTEFRTVQTNRRGRFHYSYRFSDDDSRCVRFQFRAVVPTQSDWPYDPGARGQSRARC